MENLFAVVGVSGVYLLLALGMVTVSRYQDTKPAKYRLNSCPHCGGTQSIDYEGYRYSTNLITEYKCILCSRTEEVEKPHPLKESYSTDRIYWRGNK